MVLLNEATINQSDLPMTKVKILRLPHDWLFPWTIEDENDVKCYKEFLDVKVGDIVDVSTKGSGRVRLYRPDAYLNVDDLEYISGDKLTQHNGGMNHE